MADPRAGRDAATDHALPPELETRLAAVEAAASGTDFDALSWFWMILLGLLLPVALIVTGWWLGPGHG